MRRFLIAMTIACMTACQTAQQTQPRDVTYTLQAGDTLAGLAARFYGDHTKWHAIYKANPEMRPDALKIGQVVVVPNVPPDRQPK